MRKNHALVAQLEERQPPKLDVASSNLAERASWTGVRVVRAPVLLFALLLPAVGRPAAPAVAWILPATAVTATDSAKWAVRAVPDGAGGMVVAWEENRGKRMCCRDTRDIYCQRLDAAGAKRWGETDRQLCADAAGEELLGAAPAAGGGALLLWRRGMGTLVVQELDGDGRPMMGPDGAIVSAVAGSCDWGPANCFARDEDGTACMAAWGQQWNGGASAIRVAAFTRSAGGWEGRGVTEVAVDAGVRPGAIVSCGRGLWLLVLWRDGDPVTVEGVWLGSGGRQEGKRFVIGDEPARSYVHVEAAGDGTGGAWVVWGAVIPDVAGTRHRVRVASLERKRDGGTRVMRAAAGEARTLAMFIPPTMVSVGEQPVEAATAPTVAWRATSLIVPAGAGAAILARTDGVRMYAAPVRRAGGRLSVGAPAALGGTLFTGCGIAMIPAPAGRAVLAWSETAGSGPRLTVHRLRETGGRVRDDGSPAVLDLVPGLSPRALSLVGDGAGGYGIACAGLFTSEQGGVVARKVAWR